jgi:hypothetical protein
LVESDIRTRRQITYYILSKLFAHNQSPDYNKLLSLVSAPSQLADLRKKLQALKPRIEVAQKSEMDEMLSKLKGLGNSLLGQCNELVLVETRG